MKKYMIDYELTIPGTDDTTTGTVRILAVDKIRMEAYARRHGWQLEDGPRISACTVWAALTRTKLVDESIDFDDFVNNLLIDFAPAGDDDENPTT